MRTPPAPDRRGRRRHAVGLVVTAAAVMLAALSSCASLPDSGPVRSGPAQSASDNQAPFDFTPGGPTRGADPVTVADDFLTAMTATPLNTFVAREFLTAESRKSWVPERRTVIFGSQRVEAASPSEVVLRLGDVVELDRRGAWLGTPSGGPDRTYRLRMVKVNGQWRINEPPNALIIPDSHFTSRYQQHLLYFFDPTGQVLVPEPVYVPGGAQAATLLVAGLLRGPDERLADVERTFLPRGTALNDISVPVTTAGVADVPLSNAVLEVPQARLPLVFAQLAYTLAQIPGVSRMRITVDGSPLDLPGEGPVVRLTEWSAYDPRVDFASRALFGVRSGRVLSVRGSDVTQVSGSFAAARVPLRSVSVDLPAQHVAGVTADGTTVDVATRSQPGLAGPQPRAVYAGTDLLKPAYDLHGQLWLLDRTADGGDLVVARRGRATTVVAPGVSGEDVSSIELSRDGSRLVAVIGAGPRARVVVSRVERDESGRVQGLTPARRLTLAPSAEGRLVDVGWVSPTALAVLVQPRRGVSQVVSALIDGSSTLEAWGTASDTLPDAGGEVVTSPDPGSPVYLRTTRGQLLALAENGRWTGASTPRGLRFPTFVG